MKEQNDDFTILTVKETYNMLSISRPTLWRNRRDDEDFPNPVQLSKGRIGFLKKEILEWLEDNRKTNSNEEENE